MSGPSQASGQADANGSTVPAHKPPPPSQSFGGGRFGGAPAERSKDFQGSSRRLLATMGPERLGAIAVLAAAVVSVILAVIGPRVLGRGTDIIVEGITGEGITARTDGIDLDRLGDVLLLAVGLYVASAVLSYVQTYLLAGVVQRTMYRLRADVEDKLNRLSATRTTSSSRPASAPSSSPARSVRR